jgi:predicted secreted protein
MNNYIADIIIKIIIIFLIGWLSFFIVIPLIKRGKEPKKPQLPGD